MGGDGFLPQEWKSARKSLWMAKVLRKKWAAWRNKLDIRAKFDDKGPHKPRQEV